jgi:hypothetical protein
MHFGSIVGSAAIVVPILGRKEEELDSCPYGLKQIELALSQKRLKSEKEIC